MVNNHQELDIIEKVKVQEPNYYNVLLGNDDYTPMDFVVEILKHIFDKNDDEATHIMLKVHREGIAICGVYTYEIAETKVQTVLELAKKEQHPLHCFYEPHE